MEIVMPKTLPRNGDRMPMDDAVIGATIPTPKSLHWTGSFEHLFCNNSKTSPTSSPSPKRSDILFRGRFSKFTRKNIVMRNRQVMRSSSFDTEGGPSSSPQSFRIKSRRGAVTSDLSPASSDTSVEECHCSDCHDVTTQRLSEMVTTSAPCSPTIAFPHRRKNPACEVARQDNRPTMKSTMPEVHSPTLASVAAVHLQDFIEASAQGLDSDSASEHETGKRFGAGLRKSISAKIKKKLRRQECMKADNITSLIAEFKIHDKEEIEFAVYKDKHWRDFMEWSLGRPEPVNKESVDQAEIRRRDKVWELFRSECTYLVEHILVLKEIFQERLRWLQCEGYLMHIEVAKLFANVDELCMVSTEFCRELFRKFSGGNGSTDFGGTQAVVAAFANFSSHVCPAFSRYCMNYASALQYIQTLKKQEEFVEYTKVCEQDKRCKRLKLVDLLITPIQRITKYSLLLRDIRDWTTDAKELAEMDSILRSVELSIDNLEGKVKWLSSFERLREIQEMLTWPAADREDLQDSEIVCPECLHLSDYPAEDSHMVSSHRTLVHEGPLRMIENGKYLDVYLFLFDDMLLIARKRRKLVTKRSFTGYPSTQDQMYSSLPRLRDGIFFIVCKPPIMLHHLHQAVANQSQNLGHENQHIIVLESTKSGGNISETFKFDCNSEVTMQTWLSHLQNSKRKWTEKVLRDIVPTQLLRLQSEEDRRRTF